MLKIASASRPRRGAYDAPSSQGLLAFGNHSLDRAFGTCTLPNFLNICNLSPQSYIQIYASAANSKVYLVW